MSGKRYVMPRKPSQLVSTYLALKKEVVIEKKVIPNFSTLSVV